MTTRLLLATNNPGKRVEMQDLLQGLDFALLTPRDVGLELEVEEDGQTYAENAARKALAFARASGLPALADDSGLEVDALGGQPGLHSHRFGPGMAASDAERRAYLLSRLAGLPRPWTAHFHCTVAVALPGGEVRLADGDCPGEILPEERGAGGFGYDPVFYIPAAGQTMAELGMAEKNRISHRARAIQAARPILEELMKDIAD
ncbi:MAG TPA: RdgB/HAM1 family non-canonical purine NTP pyrophosphatase [Anaerolineaceae bacterium]|nr:RdgB/HAM1 family non-canonical purine NTP pyrophosphatase [Anaerolineaceae bacterium]